MIMMPSAEPCVWHQGKAYWTQFHSSFEEPYFEATWKKVALALYNNNEEMALDNLLIT